MKPSEVTTKAVYTSDVLRDKDVEAINDIMEELCEAFENNDRDQGDKNRAVQDER